MIEPTEYIFSQTFCDKGWVGKVKFETRAYSIQFYTEPKLPVNVL